MELISIKTLSCKHLLKKFDCGIDELNNYLKRYAYKNDEENIGKTYLLMDDKTIVGYYTLANGSISYDNLPNGYKNLPKYPVPIIKLARLAVDKKYQKQSFGKILLYSIFKKAYVYSSKIASYDLVVDAKPEARGFYEHFGFILLIDSGTYFLSTKMIGEYLNINQ